jgi:glutaminyl-peptide cyclotransferase
VNRKSVALYLSIIGLLLAAAIGWYTYSFLSQPLAESVSFDGRRAYADVLTQVGFGSRVPGSEGHAQIQEWMQSELEAAGWQVEIQTSQALGHPIENLIARRSADAPQIILGAHYDTRMFADSDPDPAQHINFVPGANDGASGVAVLLELARSLPEETVPVWLVFFDAEDNGRIEGWDWILGSREFVKNNPAQPLLWI